MTNKLQVLFCDSFLCGKIKNMLEMRFPFLQKVSKSYGWNFWKTKVSALKVQSLKIAKDVFLV